MMKNIFLCVAAIIFIHVLPVTVNADFGNETKLLNDGTLLNSRIGHSVAIDGDLAIVGRQASFGHADILERDTDGSWSTPGGFNQTSSNDSFGFAVSISGNTAIVGAYRGDDNFTDAGYAKIFVRDASAGTWSEQQKLLASDASASAYFGNSVAVSGDTAIVGAYCAGTLCTGAAYVFVRDGAGAWSEQQKLVSSDIATTDNFGISVAIDGDTAIVGARLDDGTFPDSGSAYVFVRNGAGVWTQQQKLNAAISSTQYFGSGVAINGDTVVVSTDAQTAGYIETVHVFVRDTGVWSEQQVLSASDGEVGDGFGTSVSISGDTLLIGAPNDSDIVPGSGSVYAFTRTAGVWTEQPKILASDGATGDSFGQGVSISGNTVLVGSPGDDDITSGSGSVYVYTATGGTVTAPDITVTDSVAPINDLNLPFGNVTAGASSDQTITITNDGNAVLTLGTIASANPLAAPFSILSDTCSGQTLAAAANCTVGVRFAPAAAGPFSDSLDIPSDDADENTVTVNVSGTGTAVPVPDITVTDSVAPADDLQVPFGDLTEGLTSDRTVTITNDGNAVLTLGTIALANPLAAPFSILNDTCSGQTLTATSDCTFDVRFAPTGASSSTDSFDIPTNDPDESSLTVNLSGTGLSSVSNNPPSKPIFIAPANGQDVSLLPGGTLTLRWNASTDPDGDEVSYDVYLCTDADPIANCTTASASPINMSGAGTVMYASAGPVNPSGRMGLDTVFAGLAVGLMLMSVTWRDPKGWVLGILLIFAGSILASCGNNNNNTGGNTVEYQASGLSTNTAYYWAVVAKDDQGGETFSDTWRFTTR